MPRLFHRPPAYRFHRTTKQAVVSFLGKHVYLGPYGSQKSLVAYQQLLKKWETARHRSVDAGFQVDGDGASSGNRKASTITTATLRQKRLKGSPVTISELIFVYRNHAREYYQKNGEVTREAGVIDDALRILRKHYGKTFVEKFGPVALDELREKMISELDW